MTGIYFVLGTAAQHARMHYTSKIFFNTGFFTFLLAGSHHLTVSFHVSGDKKTTIYRHTRHTESRV